MAPQKRTLIIATMYWDLKDFDRSSHECTVYNNIYIYNRLHTQLTWISKTNVMRLCNLDAKSAAIVEVSLFSHIFSALVLNNAEVGLSLMWQKCSGGHSWPQLPPAGLGRCPRVGVAAGVLLLMLALLAFTPSMEAMNWFSWIPAMNWFRVPFSNLPVIWHWQCLAQP